MRELDANLNLEDAANITRTFRRAACIFATLLAIISRFWRIIVPKDRETSFYTWRELCVKFAKSVNREIGGAFCSSANVARETVRTYVRHDESVNSPSTYRVCRPPPHPFHFLWALWSSRKNPKTRFSKVTLPGNGARLKGCRRGRNDVGGNERDRQRESRTRSPNGPFRISITLTVCPRVRRYARGPGRTGQVSFFAIFNSRWPDAWPACRLARSKRAPLLWPDLNERWPPLLERSRMTP